MKPPYAPDDMIIEGLMVTASALPIAGGGDITEEELARVNIAPMGPIVGPAMERFVFRPFRGSMTYRNLKATGCGVFHVTDDALMIARAALGRVETCTLADGGAAVMRAERVRGYVLTGACRWHEVQVVSVDDREERTTIEARAVHAGRLRDFAGFNRARHAVIEAAILATRVHLTGPEAVLMELERLMAMVEKTGTEAEHEAMRLVREEVTKKGTEARRH